MVVDICCLSKTGAFGRIPYEDLLIFYTLSQNESDLVTSNA